MNLHPPSMPLARLAALVLCFALLTCTYDFGKFASGQDALTGSGGTSAATDGNIVTDGTVRATDGTLVTTDGTLVTTDGMLIATDGVLVATDSTVRTTDGTVVATGGTVRATGGTIVATGGTVRATGGTVVATGGTVVATGGKLPAATGGNTAPATGGNMAPDSGTCSSVAHSGVCWYLGTMGESCQMTCANHGQVVPEAARFVGTATQGGSLAECKTLLELLGVKNEPLTYTRTDGLGLGCHTSQNNKSWWLSSPNFSATSNAAGIRVVCGCTR